MSHNSEEGTAPAPWCRKLRTARQPLKAQLSTEALVPSSLEVMVARNRNELEGNEVECDREDSQRPGNPGVNDEGHDNDSGRPHSR